MSLYFSADAVLQYSDPGLSNQLCLEIAMARSMAQFIYARYFSSPQIVCLSLLPFFFLPGLQFGEGCNLISGLAAGARSILETAMVKKKLTKNISLLVAYNFCFGVSSQSANTANFSHAGKRKFYFLCLKKLCRNCLNLRRSKGF